MTRGSGRDERSGEAFASRWSRRKRGARAEAGAADAPRTAAAEAPAEARSDAEILRELGLPDPDAVEPGDDITGFMARAVPAHLRNRVLRRLWTSSPVLANLDGLVDYGEDFTDAALVPKALETAYRVGRGWVDDAVREEPGAAPAEATAAGETAESDVPVGLSEPAQDVPEGTAGGTEDMPDVRREPAAGPDARPRRTARKMRFRFAED